MRIGRFMLPVLPFAALSVAVPFIDRVEPRIAGLPFVLAWMCLWVVATPFCLWAFARLGRS